jgi:hypothetical protein
LELIRAIGLSLASVLIVFATPSWSLSHSSVVSAPHGNSSPVIPVYSGSIDAQNAKRALELITASEDKIVGLKLDVARSNTSNERYLVVEFNDGLTLDAGDPVDHPLELVIEGPVGRTAIVDYLVDGFYLIKFDGSRAAGGAAWKAVPVDEAAIRLNPSVRLVKTQIK